MRLWIKIGIAGAFIILIVTAVASFWIGSIYTAGKFWESIKGRSAEEIQEEVKQWMASAKAKRQEDELFRRKQKFLNISTISFHYIDKDQIESFYNDYFREPIVEQIVNEKAREASGDIKGEIKILEAQAGGKNMSKWISTMKIPNISLNEMFRRYQRETVNNNQVILGLEDVDVDLTDLENFDWHISELKRRHDFSTEEKQVNEKRQELKKVAAEKTLSRLETAVGWVLMEGKFTINNKSNDSYKMIYNHPVNEYLARETKKITFSVLLMKNSMPPSIASYYTESLGHSIPLRIYGKIWQPIDRGLDVWELQINPLVVY